MKSIQLVIVLLCSVIVVNAQTIVELKLKLKSFKTELSNLNDSILTYDIRIMNMEKENALSEIGNLNNINFLTTAKSYGYLRKGSESIFDVIAEFKNGDTINIIGFENKYWKVLLNNIAGYAHWIYLNNNEQMNLILQNYNDSIDLQDNFRLKQNETTRENELKQIKDKYGVNTYLKVLDGGHWIGMNTELASISLGYPINKNVSKGNYGVHEQWVYDKMYLYFENDKLTSVQYSR